MSDAGEFIDAGMQREASGERAADQANGLRAYGSSVGAIRGTVRDAFRRHRGMDHDPVLSLCSELWAVPVFERRLAAVVVLQSKLSLLQVTDLTRIEGFLRQAGGPELTDPLAIDVVGPLIDRLLPRDGKRAAGVLDRWAGDVDPWLSRAALLSPLRPLRAGGGDWDGFIRRARAALAENHAMSDVVSDAVALVLGEMAGIRPELTLPRL
ncbi:DNA alkylation repair protein [Arthrobacter sp. CAN_A1]|uniref:DNA alkylation repair protein n=1 Tax=Arthrobacter sp. CAN_A1 TaxID=2787717 RepID=UPI0018C9ABA0